MHIANVEIFKAWLVENIKPLCDADPIPLSKYVLALVKKDKDEKELKSICNDQLDVFFQENTVEFVEKLFQVLKDESYLSSQVGGGGGAGGAPTAAPAASTGGPLPQQSQPPEDDKQRTAVKRKASSGIGAAASSSTAAPSAGNSVKSSGKPPDSKVARVADSSAAIKQPPVPIRAPSPPPLQSQQQQPAKDLRSTLNSRSSSSSNSTSASSRHHHHNVQQQQQQQQQQQIQTLHHPQHQQVGQQMPAMPAPMQAPMPPFQQPPSMPPAYMPMPAPQGFYPPQMLLPPPLPPLPPPPPPPPPSLPPPPPTSAAPLHQATRPRCRDYDEKGVCLLGAACPYDHGAHPVTVTPGDPAYGKFFPGAVVITGGGAGGGMQQQQPQQQQQQHHHVMPPAPPHVSAGYAPVLSTIAPTSSVATDSGHRNLPQQHQQHPIPPPPVASVQTTAPTAIGSAASSAAVQPTGLVPIVLGSVPQQQQQQQQLHHHHQPQMPHHHLQHHQHHQQQTTTNRIVQPIIGGGVGDDLADAAASSATESTLTCTVELRRVPANLNNPASLGSHFCRFGTVLDIQTSNESGDMAEPGGGGHAPLPPDSARVTFSSPAEALAAYRCPEAVLNNRFIRMFMPGGGGGGGQQRLSAKERLGGRHQNAQQHQQQPRRRVNLRQTSVSSSEGGGGGGGAGDGADASESQMAAAAPSRASLTWTPHSAEATAKAAEAAAAAAAERKQEGARIQQVQRAALERAKAHRELRVKQIRMLKDCKESLAKLGTLFSKAKETESRHAIAETMKPINAQIRDLESSLGVVSTGSVALRDLQKELLDLELEIYQKEGLEPVADQKKRLAEVRKLLASRLPQQQQKIAGGVGGSVHGPGGPGGSGAGAAGGGASGGVPTFAQTRLDKRSRTLKVAAGFSGVGQVEDLLRQIAQQSGAKPQGHQQTPGGHHLLVDFATRAEAEAAMARFPKSLDPDRPYKVEWSQSLAVPAKVASAEPAAAASTKTSE